MFERRTGYKKIDQTEGQDSSWILVSARKKGRDSSLHPSNSAVDAGYNVSVTSIQKEDETANCAVGSFSFLFCIVSAFYLGID